MKKIEVQGAYGVWVEVYKTNDTMTDVELLKEAAKILNREVLRRESGANGHINRQPSSNGL